MRYVIVIAAAAFFVAWDLVYNQGQYISHGIKAVTEVVRYFTG